MAATAIAADTELAVIARTVENWNSHDIDGVLDCMTEDVYWDDPAMPSPARNKAEVRRWCEIVQRAIPDFHFAIVNVYCGPEHHYAVEWKATGTLTGPFDPPGFAPTNRHFVTHGVDTQQFRDGRICRIVTTFHEMRASEQMGLLPPRARPGSPGERLFVALQHVAAWFQRRSRGSLPSD